MPQIDIDAPKRQAAARRKLIARMVGGVVLLALIGLTAFLIYQYHLAQQEAEYQKMLKQVAADNTTHQYKAARDTVEAYLPHATKGVRLCKAIDLKAQASYDLKDYEPAKTTYEQLGSTDGCSKLQSIQGLAIVSAAMGDHQALIDYYKQEIELWPKNDPDYNNWVRDLSARIKRLGGQP